MEALCLQPSVEDNVRMQDDEGGAMEASSPVASSSGEETDEDSEAEPPLAAVRRKVSFADAFGLNLVSVKEFDNVEVAEAEVSLSPKGEATHPLQGFYMTCLFTVPSSQEELDLRLQAQMVELESIELLPGTTTLRGIVRVVNLCYTKFVYARVSLDRWNSYFDLLAEYVPGSSDTKTDRFTFKYTLVPPFGREGTRLEFCLRYETSVGTFWANNLDMNYVLFCHQRGQMKEHGPRAVEESANCRSKRSCLKAKRRGSTKDKTKEIVTINAATKPADAAQGDRRTADPAGLQPSCCKGHKRLACSSRNQDRATREARVKGCLSQMPKAHSPDSAQRQKKPSHEVLTYHQIPLLTLDWNNDKQQEWENSDMDDFWTRAGKLSLAGASQKDTEETPPGNDMWGSLLNGTDENPDRGASACEVWQAFLNGPGCEDHSGVPESEWLQTAASVSPSNHAKPQNRYASSHEGLRGFLAGMDTPTTLRARASAACQLLSAIRETRPADVAANSQDRQPAEGRGDDTVTRGASQRSQTRPQEFGLQGAAPVSEGSVDSSAQCHKRATREREGEEIIGEAEPFTLHTADLVTSSGESQTTDMTAMPESQNATSVDRISQGARLREGLSSSGEKDVTGTAHNARHDTLAFKETIRQGTKDGEGFAVCTSRRAAEEKICNASTEEEIFRPQKMKECEISRSDADEKECGELRMNQTEGNENAFTPKPLCEDKSETLGPNQTEEGKRLSGITEPLREHSDPVHDGVPPSSAHGRIPDAVETVEPRWTHSQEDEEEITARVQPLKRTEEDTGAAVEPMGNVGGSTNTAVERHQPVEGEILSEGAKEPITAETTAESGPEEMLLERFAEDLVSGICEEVFGCNRDTVGGTAGPKLSLPTIGTRSNKRSRRDKSQSLTTAAQTRPASELRTDFSSSAHLGQDRAAAPATLGRPPTSAPRNQEDCYQIKKGSVRRQEAGGQTGASSETIKQSRGLILYSLSHITRLLMCALLVVGSFALAFLYDLPAFFALYVVSLCYWLYKWRRRRQAATKEAEAG